MSYSMILTKPQRQAVAKIARRINNERPEGTPPIPYRTIRRTVQPGYDCIMMPFAGMWLGIEKDGYTHS